MVKAVYLLAVSILTLLFFAVCTADASEKQLAKVDMKVLSELDSNSNVNVIILLKNNTDKFSVSSVESQLAPEKVKYNFQSFKGFSAKLDSNDLQKLESDSNVEAIYYDLPVHIALQDSVPLIRANDTWDLQVSGTNLTGKGQTVCIIDTGVDYTHPDLGNCTPQQLTLNGTAENLTTPVESDHPYNNSFDYTWKINKTNYTKIGVHFVNLSLENSTGASDSTDRVIIYNSNMSEIAQYRNFNGPLTDFWVPYSDGDTIYVRLATDGSVSSYGFYIDQIRNGTTNTTYDWSACTKVIEGWDFVNNDGDPMDDNNHGTHVAGIVAANGTLKGVAPDASIIAGKVMDSSGSGLGSNLIAGIEFCNNRSADYNISVISMSIAHLTYVSATYCDAVDPLISAAINNSVAKNISVIIAAGNLGNTTAIGWPACMQNAIPVGSTDKSDNFSDFSNRNSLVQLFAPGSGINSTWWPGGGYHLDSGTSMATPHVAGAFAIMNQYLKLTGQTKTPQQIESIFNSTGKQITDANYSNLTYSRIDVYAAITSLVYPSINVISPINNTWYNGAKFNVTLNEAGTCWFSLNNQSNVTMTNASSTSFYYTNTSINETATNHDYNVTFYCNNSVGNLNSSSLLFFGVHKGAPNVTLSSPADLYSTTGTTTIPFQFSVTDALNIAQCDLIIGGSVAASNSSAIVNNSANTISKSMSAGSYTWSVNCTDEAGNVGNSSSRSLTINSASTGGQTNNNDNTGNVNVASEAIIILPGESKDENIALGSSFGFSTGTETHRIKVSQIYSDSVEFVIYSSPLTFVLKVGQTKRLDLSGNGKYDIELTLLSVIGNTVNLRIKPLVEGAVPQGTVAAESANQTAENKTTEANAGQEISENELIYVGLGVLCVLFLLSMKLKRRKR
jgi:subtilisin family serine protease